MGGWKESAAALHGFGWLPLVELPLERTRLAAEDRSADNDDSHISVLQIMLNEHVHSQGRHRMAADGQFKTASLSQFGRGKWFTEQVHKQIQQMNNI